MNPFQRFWRWITSYMVNWHYLLTLTILFLSGIFICALYIPLPEPQMALASEVYDRHHHLLATFYHQNRKHIQLEEIPQFLQNAFLAVEDHRFFQHRGINPGRILKAAWHDLVHLSLAQGASTITQQLVKNVYLSHERSFSRKLKELFYTLKLEFHLSKIQILELYLNQIYFGHGAYGVKAAAETYFQKNLDQLNSAEMALLAGLPKGPAYYSPYRHPRRARTRLQQTLKRMQSCGFISAEEYSRYQNQPLSLPGLRVRQRQAPYFLDLLQEEIATIFPNNPGILANGGLIIESTLDLELHALAIRSLQSGLPKMLTDAAGLAQPQSALIAIDPKNGAIRTLIGGTNYQLSQFNRATQAKRQPGSAFKPLLYATALSSGYTLATKIDRTPKTYSLDVGTYQPTDGSNPNTSGLLSLREALASSSNVIAVKLLDALGFKAVQDYAAQTGIVSKLPSRLSLALGSGEVTPLELTTAYLPFANGGLRIKPTTIHRIIDRHGKVLYQHQPKPEPVIDPGVAFLMTHALASVLKPGGTAANIGHLLKHPAAGKTGTTEANRDAWFVGYTPQLAAAVFVGCDHNEKPLPGGANTIAAPIWADFMKNALANQEVIAFPIPDNIIQVDLCTETGLKATLRCPKQNEFFLAGTEPKEYCTAHRYVRVKICKKTRLLPNSYCEAIEEEEFLLGEQPTTICTECQPKFHFFQWMRRWLQR